MNTLPNRVCSEAFQATLREWHAALYENRGERAELRRAKTPAEVCISRAYHRGIVARWRARGITLSPEALRALALPVGVLAHAKALRGEHFAALFATHKGGSQEAKDARFIKLLHVPDDDPDLLYRSLLRLVRLMEYTAEPLFLVLGATCWNETTRLDWAMHYYHTTPSVKG